MMPGLSHEMHVHIYMWWHRLCERVQFHHTTDAMRELNKINLYRGEHVYLPHTIDMPYRVTPSVFHMFRMHMWMRHNVIIEEVQECLDRSRTHLSFCCTVGGHRKFFL